MSGQEFLEKPKVQKVSSGSSLNIKTVTLLGQQRPLVFNILPSLA